MNKLFEFNRVLNIKIGKLWRRFKQNFKPSTDGADALQIWWGFSYAQYLTIPRSVMQSMPDEWQEDMAELLCEMDKIIDWRPINGRYYCQLRDKKGRFMSDPLADYERGRRRVN